MKITINGNLNISKISALINRIEQDHKYGDNAQEWEISENQSSGYNFAYCEDVDHCLVAQFDPRTDDVIVKRHYSLRDGGIEFFEDEAPYIAANDYAEMSDDDKEQFRDILETLGEVEVLAAMETETETEDED